ncbi:MAG: TauD/TfdA family dioxygenase [Actinomycetota bacterium]
MTVLDAPPTPQVELVGGAIRLTWNGHVTTVHPLWLRDRTTEPGWIDSTNRQRLFTPVDIPIDLSVVAAEVCGDDVVVRFSDEHVARLDLAAILCDLRWTDDPEAPPPPEPWTAPLATPAHVDWASIGWCESDADPHAVLHFLDAFYRHGYVVFRNTPAEHGTVERVANRLGYISGQSFGWTFDVRVEPRATDLAYTSVALLAHTDQPYRIDPPGIQLLHCILNDAEGGDSTIVDGLAAARAVRDEQPSWFRALVEIEVGFRYDRGDDTAFNTGHVLEFDRHGRYQGIRLSSRLDTPLPRTGDDLDAWYRGRRWLTEWLDDPAHQATFRLEPGDVMFMDNHRALHGRTAFDVDSGARHLQGCYIEHDGPDTMYRLTLRRLRGNLSG